MKQCSRCTHYKDESQFAAKPSRPDGLSTHCLDCMAQINREWYEANKEKQKRRVLERRAAIAAGTYVPKATKGTRQRHKVELPSPQKPVRYRALRLDENEDEWLIAAAAERGMTEEALVREIIRAAMVAHQARKAKS